MRPHTTALPSPHTCLLASTPAGGHQVTLGGPRPSEQSLETTGSKPVVPMVGKTEAGAEGYLRQNAERNVQE